MKNKDMILKYTFLGLLGLSLFFTSCKQEEVMSTAVVKQDDYMTLQLALQSDADITSGEEDARAQMYLGSGNKPTIFFGNDGDKVKVQTNLYKGLADGTFKTIFTQALDWTVTNGGTRLVYKGGISILRNLLQDAKTYHIVAMLGVGDNQQFRHSSFWDISRGKINPLELSVPMLMQADLVRQGVEGRTLVNKDISRSRFIPRGHLILLSVTNSSSQAVTPFQAQYDHVGGSVVTMYSVGLPLDGGNTLIPRFNYAAPEQTNYYRRFTKRYVFRGVEQVAIAPGTTQRFVAFTPNFFADPNSKLRILFNAPTSSDKVIDRLLPVPSPISEQVKGIILRHDVEVIP